MPEGVAGIPAGVVAVADAADDAHPGGQAGRPRRRHLSASGSTVETAAMLPPPSARKGEPFHAAAEVGDAPRFSAVHQGNRPDLLFAVVRTEEEDAFVLDDRSGIVGPFGQGGSFVEWMA